jgi:hypothetical protein
VRYADPRVPLNVWSKIDPDVEPGHWWWTGAVGANGRGSVWVSDENEDGTPVWYQPHVLIFRRGGGVLTPERPVVRHRCDRALCVRWDCLEPGSHAENARDRVERGRHRSAPRLAPAVVLAIRERVVALGGGQVTSRVAREFDVDPRTVRRIRAGQTHNPNGKYERI